MSITWDDLISGYEETISKTANEIVQEEPDCQLPAEAADKAGEKYAPRYIFLRRRHFMEGLVYAYTDLYLDDRIFRMAPDAFRKDMVLRVLSMKLGNEIGAATQRITMSSADTTASELLDLAIGAPIGELLRRVVDQDGTLIYRAVVFYRGDLVRIETKLK